MKRTCIMLISITVMMISACGSDKNKNGESDSIMTDTSVVDTASVDTATSTTDTAAIGTDTTANPPQ